MADKGYQGPHEGFRGEVTAAAEKELLRYNDSLRLQCPSCGDTFTLGALKEHAVACIDLRDDVASTI